MEKRSYCESTENIMRYKKARLIKWISVGEVYSISCTSSILAYLPPLASFIIVAIDIIYALFSKPRTNSRECMEDVATSANILRLIINFQKYEFTLFFL